VIFAIGNILVSILTGYADYARYAVGDVVLLEIEVGRVRLMTTRFVATIAAVIFAVLIVTPGFTCTTLCLLEKSQALVAYNYDAWAPEGLVLVNKRGTSKKSRVKQGASWTARYGNVTFNQFGRDEPNSGVNEKGLMVSLMWLDATRWPPADHRPAVGLLEWIQYNLDNYASVAEVVANAEAVRPMSQFPLHYLFADASGDAAVIEFLDGKLVVYRGDTLPVKALANSTYADSIAAFEAARRTGQIPTTASSLDRFVRGAILASGDGDPIARGFVALAAVASSGRGRTRWSIVYDLGASEVYFKTDTSNAIRRVSVTSFDFSCRMPVKMLDVAVPRSGDVATAFVDYTPAANRALVEAAYTKTPFLSGKSETERASAADHADATSACAVTD
jgi:penicillin V acylase-like amidase (Ntn superfamily)